MPRASLWLVTATCNVNVFRSGKRVDRLGAPVAKYFGSPALILIRRCSSCTCSWQLERSCTARLTGEPGLVRAVRLPHEYASSYPCAYNVRLFPRSSRFSAGEEAEGRERQQGGEEDQGRRVHQEEAEVAGGEGRCLRGVLGALPCRGSRGAGEEPNVIGAGPTGRG